MGETSRGDVGVLEDASLVWSKKHAMIEPCLKEPPFKELCGDVVMGSDTPSIEHTDPICFELFDLTPTSSPLLPTTPSHLYAYHESLSDIKGYSPNLDLYCAYLEDVLSKIVWSTFFDHTFDFSMAFGKFKRPLTFFCSSFVVFSYLHHFKIHVVTYGKLLKALTASESRTRLLRD